MSQVSKSNLLALIMCVTYSGYLTVDQFSYLWLFGFIGWSVSLMTWISIEYGSRDSERAT